jgi:8-oxo-dGTP pyrophosphatase MutT (NUDIX family)
LHRTVVSEVFDSEGRWLLVRQADDRQDAGRWVSPVGGHVQAGEGMAEALARETLEELGFAVGHAREVGQYLFCRTMPIGTIENLSSWREQRSDTIPRLNHESVEYRYFDEAELRLRPPRLPSSSVRRSMSSVERSTASDCSRD